MVTGDLSDYSNKTLLWLSSIMKNLFEKIQSVIISVFDTGRKI